MDKRKSKDQKKFINKIRGMGQGDSFLINSVPSNFRTAIAILQDILEIKITCRKENGKVRVKRTH